MAANYAYDRRMTIGLPVVLLAVERPIPAAIGVLSPCNSADQPHRVNLSFGAQVDQAYIHSDCSIRRQ